MKKICLCALLVSAPFIGMTPAQAAVATLTSLKIETTRAFINHGTDYNFEIKISTDTPFTVPTCTATTTNRIFTYVNATTGIIPALQMLQAQANYADAQNRLIEITYDNAACDATRGFRLLGIRVLPPTP